jgi:hypothetical protein
LQWIYISASVLTFSASDSRLLTSNEDSSSGLAISEAILRRTDVWFEKEEDSQESIAFEVGSVRISSTLPFAKTGPS